ncbi:hypothetical protein TNCV_201821 [Trichonephila clavipes]|nr:hypothetical protein TNCV_201821 [Trichonephila clavipes]
MIYSQFGLAIHQNDHQARRRFIERAQNEIAVVPDFHKRILFSDEAHFWLNGYVNKQNCRIWSEANPQVARVIRRSIRPLRHGRGLVGDVPRGTEDPSFQGSVQSELVEAHNFHQITVKSCLEAYGLTRELN